MENTVLVVSVVVSTLATFFFHKLIKRNEEYENKITEKPAYPVTLFMGWLLLLLILYLSLWCICGLKV